MLVIYNSLLNDFGDDLEDAVKNYDNKSKYDCVLVVANLGLWYGRRQAQKTFKNLYTALQTCAEQENKVYFDNKKTTLKLNAYHHDGINLFKFYKVVNGRKYAIKYNNLLACY